MSRPNPLLWLYYAFGGRLPDRYREWVLHDGTTRHWMRRAFLRTLTQCAPVVIVLLVIFLVLGVPWFFAAGCVVLGLVVSIYYALSYSVESIDGRLTRYGYPPRYASTLRQERYDEEHQGDAQRYREMWRSED